MPSKEEPTHSEEAAESMADLSELAPWKRAPLLGLGAGLLAGGLEAIQISVTLKLSMTFFEGVLLALTSCLLGALVALAMSLPAGLLAHLLTRRWLTYRRHALSLALVGAGLGAWYLLPAARDLMEQDRAQAAFAFALTPIGIGGVVWFNALFWLRREYIDAPPRLGWWFWSAAGALLISLIAGAWMSQRDLTRKAPIETDPDVLLITIDTLRRDHVSAYGVDPEGAGGPPPVQTPVMDALAARGILYRNAIAPMPETLPAHSAMFTGLHPVRSGVLSNGHTLSGGYQTLAERLSEEGYATGAFVSSFAVDSRTGLDQGFQVYDDDFFPLVRGLSEIQAAHLGKKAIMRLLDPTDFPFLLERTAPATMQRALDWLARNEDRPTFAWIHLFEPHAPYEPHGLPGFEDNGTPDDPSVDHREILSNEAEFTYTDEVRARLRRLYAEEVAYTDQQLGAFLEALDARQRGRPRLLILTADHGEMLGEHGYEFNHHGIYEQAIQVPLLIQPVEFSEMTRSVDEQVRLMDVLATVLKQLGLEAAEKTESGDLVKYAELPGQRGYTSLLMGRHTASLVDGTLYGYRARNQEGGDIKYIWSPGEQREELYDLRSDPREQQDISARQPEVGGALRQRVQQELEAAGISPERLRSEADPATLEALRALGYME